MIGQLDKYTLGYRLYRGIDHEVFRATRSTDGQEVLLKVLNPTELEAEARRRLTRDFEVSKDLTSSSFLRPVLNDVQDLPNAFIFEAFPGANLQSLLQSGRLEADDVLAIAIELTKALDKLHRQQVIHKDLRPANVYWDQKSRTIKLTGMGLSSFLKRERPLPQSALPVGGDLAYFSPEQTGRMNRTLDYRTDFYSLGITLYHCLTGKLPFQSKDYLELTYCHIAKVPTPPNSLNKQIPQPLSDIIMKLLAKSPDSRYQSSFGLLEDLRLCQENFQESEATLILGQFDRPEQFCIPERLYGREKQVSLLLDAFSEVSHGATEVLLVAGFSGVGKTRLVQEVHKPIVRRRGSYICGKYDQYKRHIPYSAIIEAFRDLLRQMLSWPRARVEKWKETLLTALGSNGQVLIEVIPELEYLIGKQPDLTPLPAMEAQNRFNLVFTNFVQHIAQKDHPLVLFLDDLQWADVASLRLIHMFATKEDIHNFLLLGAYRDNEVDQSHPFVTTTNSITRNGGRLRTIKLSPLNQQDLTQLCADTLRLSREKVESFSQLLFEKTAGNPFFLKQFLYHLVEENILLFEQESHSWRWELERIKAMTITDNVVELIVDKLATFQEETREALKAAACLGNRFSLKVLSYALCEEPATVLERLVPALRTDIIVQRHLEGATLAEQHFAFLHDRLQEAAYALFSKEDLLLAHLKFGRVFLEQMTSHEKEEHLFLTVNLLNFASSEMATQNERTQLSELNLKAGRRAKAGAAFNNAIKYFERGISTLPNDCWESCYDLTLSLHVEAVEAAYIDTNFAAADKYFQTVVDNAKSILDQVKVYEIRAGFLISQNKMQETLDVTLPILEKLGFPLSLQPEDQKLVRKLPSLEDLSSEPIMKDPKSLAAMQLLVISTGAAYQGKPRYMVPIVFRLVNLSLTDGLSPLSAYAYGCLALIMCGSLADLELGRNAGQLCVRLSKQFDVRSLKCKTNMVFHSFVSHWFDPHKNTINSLAETIQMGLEIGDFVYVAYCAIWSSGYLFFTGHPISFIEHKIQEYTHLFTKIEQDNGIFPAKIWRQLALSLKEDHTLPCLLKGESLRDDDLAELKELDVILTQFFLHFARLILSYIFNDQDNLRKHAQRANELEGSAIGSMLNGGFAFYYSLAQLKICTGLDDTSRQEAITKVEEHLEKMRAWSKECISNFKAKILVVEAELAWCQGHTNEALGKYQTAIEVARENGFTQEAAIAAERALECCLTLGQLRFARIYLSEALKAYKDWGATGKCDALKSAYPQLCNTISIRAEDELGQLNKVDTATLMKASRALSSEIDLRALIKRLMKLALQNSGARRGILLLKKESTWTIEAIAHDDEDKMEVLSSHILTDSKLVPEAIIRYAARTGESVVLHNAVQEGAYTEDPIVKSRKLKSVLCLPIFRHEQMSALLYLDNELLEGLFTKNRLSVLQVLVAQAAISLENAELFQQKINAEKVLLQKKTELEKATALLSNVMNSTPDLIFVQDPDRQIIMCNNAFAQCVGKTTDEIVGLRPEEVGWQSPSQGEQSDALVFEGAVVHEPDISILTFSGKRTLDLHRVPLRNSFGEIIAILCVGHDLTERKSLEEQLLQSQKMEAIGTLAGGIAHDFNNLLQAILGYTTLLQFDIKANQPGHQELSFVVEAARRATQLTRQLLTFSRRQKIDPKDVNITDLIDKFVQLVRRVIGESIELKLLAESEAVLVHADASQIEQVLMNLSVNARDAMPNGGVLTIKTETATIDENGAREKGWTKGGPYFVLSVSDTGHGIPEDKLDKIFEPFFTTKEVGKGTGLGLATVYGVVRRHEGYVEVESKTGVGSTFSIYLPCYEAGDINENGVTTQAMPKGNETILVAEDDEMVRRLAQQVLTSHGYTVLTAADGEETLALIQKQDSEIDLVLMDVIMPKMSGPEVVTRLGSLATKIKFLFTSGYSEDKLDKRTLASVNGKLLHKPYSITQLLQRVREVVEQ